MKSQEKNLGLRISNCGLRWRARALICGFVLLFFPAVCAQPKIALLVPEKKTPGLNLAETLQTPLAAKFNVLDSDLSAAAFRSVEAERPFNLTTGEAKLIGAAIGCDFFLLLRAENQRRFSFVKKEYFESFAVVYLVSSRTGRLVLWKLLSFEDGDAETAEKKLMASASALASEISARAESVLKSELNEKPPPKLEEIPDEKTAAAQNFRPPLPFRRLSPAYTKLAAFYKIEATVDIEVDFDESGHVQRAEIVRWAGFGLDESVEEAVRKMNWRAAERNKKSLPVRALLRYNFKKLEKEEEF